MGGTRSRLLFVSLTASAFASMGATEVGDAPFTTVLVANLNFPTFVTYAPDDFERVFVTEKRGRILIIKNGKLLSEPFLDISDRVVANGQRGLRGLAFHPDYQNSGYFYVNYTLAPNGELVMTRYAVTADPDVADPDSEEIVLATDQTDGHRGGWIGFGPNDGYLYIARGDGGPPESRSQDTTSLHGKVLRLDVDGDDFPGDPSRNYAIPQDNPFVGGPGADEIWALGLRQAWRASFDRGTGDFYVADVGHHNWEEVNFQAANTPGAVNYGWKCKEGLECENNPEPGCDCNDPGLTDAIFLYEHPRPDFGAAVVGGYVYRGGAIDELQGKYIFADHFTGEGGKIWSFCYDGKEVTDLTEIQDDLDPGDGLSIDHVVSFGEDADGELYICAGYFNQGEIFKIVPTNPPCSWDLDDDGNVGVGDLLALFALWGPCPALPGCPGDFNSDGAVGVGDMLALFANWGPCP